MRDLFYTLTGTTVLNNGDSISEAWRQERVNTLQFRWHSTPPSYYGWHEKGKTAIALAADISICSVAETMLHELVHAVCLTDELDGHPPLFYEILTLAAQEAFDMPDSVELTGDEQLTYWLQSVNWSLPAVL